MLAHGGSPPDGLRRLPEVSLSWSDAVRTRPVHRTSRGPTPVRGTPFAGPADGEAVCHRSLLRTRHLPDVLRSMAIHDTWDQSCRLARLVPSPTGADRGRSLPQLVHALALASAVVTAGATILIRLGFRGADTFTGYWINLVVGTAGLWLAVLVLAPSAPTELHGILYFVLAGLVGTTAGRLLRFVSIDRVGASVAAALDVLGQRVLEDVDRLRLRRPLVDKLQALQVPGDVARTPRRPPRERRAAARRTLVRGPRRSVGLASLPRAADRSTP